MNNVFDTIECQILIMMNWLPIYQILLITYLFVPIAFIIYYNQRFIRDSPIIASILTLGVWLIQMIVWNIGYKFYYQI